MNKFFVCLVFALCPSICFSQQSESRVALVIGNSAYTNIPLKNPVNDAADMSARLKGFGFTVIERNNLKTKQIGSTLREFRSKLTPGSVALVFYAGHGVTIKGKNFLPAVDAEINGEEDVPNQSLGTEQIMDVLAEAKTRLNLVFLDACRDNPYARSFRTSSRGLSRESAPSGTLISFATKPGSVAADGTGRNGLYTSVLLEQLKNSNQPIEQVLKKVVSGVRVASKNQQEPWMEGSIEGDFCFGGCGQTAVSQVPAELSESQKEDSFWNDVKAAGNKEAFEAYIKKYPNGRYLDLAKANINKLNVLNPSKVDPPPSVTRKDGPLKIAFAYVGPVGDGGWTFAHDNARKAIEKEFGNKVSITYTENVSESMEAQRFFQDMVTQGNRLIFGTTFGYMEPMLRVAAKNPSVKFEHATGYKQAENLRTYDSRTYEGAYMAGVIAGKMTKSNILGFVASIPIPEVVRNINSFTLGAQSVNPKVKTKVVWVNEWFNPPKEKEAAISLINGGADILFQNTDSPAVLKTAEAKGKRAFGWDSDMKAYAPKAHLASSITNWAPYYIKATREALEGKWVGGTGVWWGVKEGAIDIVSVAEDVSADTKAKIDEIKTGLKDGSFVIWKGPIFDNIGKTLLDQDEVANDEFLSGINFYVKGVVGSVPGANK
jgi:simple sugar transport system substrate-binding protein